jgi:hypothetical protein
MISDLGFYLKPDGCRRILNLSSDVWSVISRHDPARWRRTLSHRSKDNLPFDPLRSSRHRPPRPRSHRLRRHRCLETTPSLPRHYYSRRARSLRCRQRLQPQLRRACNRLEVTVRSGQHRRRKCPLENQQNHHRYRRRPSPARPRRRHLLEAVRSPQHRRHHKSPPQVRYRRLPAQSRSPPRPPLRARHHLPQGPSLFNRSQRDAHQERRWLWSMASQFVSRAIGSSAPRGFGHRAPLHAGRQHRIKGCGTSSAEVRYFACCPRSSRNQS